MALSTLGLILFFLVLLAAFFSAAEIGMMSINRYRLRYLVKNNHRQAKRVHKLLEHPEKLLGVVLIGSTLANIVASMVSTLLGQRIYGQLGVAIATGALTVIILVFAELAPKTLAALHTERVAFACSWLLSVLQLILSPVVRFINWIANLCLKCFGVNLDKDEKESLSREELRSVVHESGGLLRAEHKGMLISLLDLEAASVEDIMIPKNEIVGLDITLPWQDILDSLETAQHTRMPVYENSIDNLYGIVHLRRLLNLLLEEELDKASFMEAIEPPYYIPESTLLNTQILNFQKMKRRSGFVVDEYGDLQGLVTLEDILEEVVGEFTTNIASLSKDIRPESSGSTIIDASIHVRDLNRSLGMSLPLIGPRTLSGLIIEYLGCIPPAQCCIKLEGHQIEILKVSENRIKSVRFLGLAGSYSEEHHD